ncbi:MAG: DUF4129 domain-containing protein, partial [Gammaproteobacteria bacterium]|nr:DUF4129 domain-containing protein [Gammaproteobacteria bacterium]
SGLNKAEYEGAFHFANRAIMKFPLHKNSIKSITDIYQQLRYQNNSENNLTEFKKQVSAFHI